MTIKGFSQLFGDKFDSVANASSSMYFAVLFAFLILGLTNQTSKENKDICNALLIATLILPMIYFGKLGFQAAKRGDIVGKYQKMVLSMYFILILLTMILYFAKIDDKNWILYIKLYVLPFLTIFSFYGIYEMIKNNKLATHTIALCTCLALLYYTSLFDSAIKVISGKPTETNEALTYIIAILSFFLMVLFAFIAVKGTAKKN